MKNFLFLVFFVVFSFQTNYAQKRYDRWWKEVENHELNGRSKSALEKVNFIYKKAKRQNKDQQFVKAFLYKAKYELILKKDIRQAVYQNFENEIKVQKTPVKQILSSILAESLNKYYQRNRYKIRQRSKTTTDSLNTDFETWNAGQFEKHIVKLYQNSLKNQSELLKLQDKDYTELLDYGENFKHFQTSLYDLLARRYLSFLTEDRFDYARKQHGDSSPLNKVFTLPKEFVRFDFFEKNAKSKAGLALRFFQKVERAHLEDEDKRSLLAFTFQRLDYFWKNTPVKNSNAAYFKALQNLKKEFAGKKERAWIAYKLARFYHQNANKKRHPDFHKHAEVEAQKSLKLSPNGFFSTPAKLLLQRINRVALSFQNKNFIIPDKQSKILLHFRNTDTVHLTVFSMDQDFKMNYRHRDSLVKRLIDQQKPILQKSYVLPNNADHYQYSTELLLPKLSKGRYMLLFSRNKQPEPNKDFFVYGFLQATDLAYVEIRQKDGNTNYLLTDRENGTPLKNVRTEISPKPGSPGQPIITKSDEKGLVRIKTDKDYDKSWTVTFSKAGDTLTVDNFTFYEPEKHKPDIDFNSHLLTDRGIYRPGQTVYFKGILSFQHKKLRETANGAKVKVVLSDVNNEEIAVKHFTTNAFGSFHGEFSLPKSGLNGDYHLHIEEEFEKGSKWYRYRDDFDGKRKSINVEDYKRPTFEVKMDSLQKTYVLGDTIELTGNANAFFGGNLSNSEVHYTIDRKFPYNPLFRRSGTYLPIKDVRLKSGKTKTDDSGKFTFEFSARPDSAVAKRFKPVFDYVVKAEVTDINGETRSVTKTISVGYHTAQMTILVPEEVKLGQKQTIELVSKDLNGRKIKTSGALKLYRYKKSKYVFVERPWDIPDIQSIPEEKFRKLFPHQTYDSADLSQNRQNVLIKTFHISKQNHKIIALDSLNGLQTGNYLAEYKGKGPKGFDIESKSGFHLNNPEEKAKLSDKFLTVSTDVKSSENGGSTLTMTFSTPLDELSVFAEVAYNKKRHWQKIIHLKKGITQKQLDLPKGTRDIYLQTIFEKANSFQSNYTKVPSVQSPEKNLHLETVHFKDKLTPGGKETWELKVLDDQNKPAKAEVLASMYDESLDDFTYFKWTPQLVENPNRYYYNSGLSALRFRDNAGEDYSNSLNRPGYPRVYYNVRNFTDFKKFGYDFVNSAFSQKTYLKILKLNHETQKHAGEVGFGRVHDTEGIPLPGVTITVPGTDRGTQTDFDGKFFIRVKKGEMLLFSYVGFKDVLRKVTQPMNVRMKENRAELQEVTVSGGYRSNVQMDNAYEEVSSKNKSNTEILNELQGRAAGLQINAGEEISNKVILRGVGSRNDSGEPLFVVDGVPVGKSEFLRLQKDNIVNVNVLKGPEATSLYGNRGKNGVVVINTKKGVEALENIKPRKNLQETAFFFPELKTDKKGNVRFSFDSPEALTRWKFQAFAHTKTLQQGYLKLNTVTQKDLNIVPNLPRFFRAGDTVVISAKINNLSKKGLSGIAKLDFQDEIKQKNIQLITDKAKVKNFQLKAKGNVEVHWKLIIPEKLSAVRYTITAKAGNFTDGQTDVVPVLSNRIFVTESLPIWVNPKEEKSFTLNNLETNTSKSLQNHRLIFEYTSNPAWTALRALPYLIEFPYDCAEQVFARYYANTLSKEILNANPQIADVVKNWQENDSLKTELEKNQKLKNILLEESPWLKTAVSQKAQQQRLADLLNDTATTKKAKATLLKLKQMQLASGGFPWFQGGHANTAISIHILTGLGRLGQPETGSILQETYNEITKNLMEFLDEKFSQKHRNKESEKVYTFGSNGLHYLYARRFFNRENKSFEAYKTKAFVHYREEWLQLDLQEKIVLALIAADFDKTDFAQKILNALKENAVINSDAGMYWKENTSGFGWHQDPIETQALAIEAFSKINNDKKTVNTLKTWLLKQKQTQAWKSTKATTDAIYALLVKGDDLLSKTPSPEISIGKEKLSFDSNEGKAGYLKKAYKPKEITPEKATVHIKNDSKTPQFGGLYWQYFENSDHVKKSNLKELQLKKELFVNKESSEGKTLVPLTERNLNVGDLLTVRLTIKAKTDFAFMHLKDMRASGLEPVDVISKYKFQYGLVGYYQSTKDVATHFFFDHLPKGTYVLEYELRVNNPGEFSNGITRLQSMYAPEFSVQSSGRRIEIGKK